MSGFYPEDDDFAYGTAPYGANLIGWLGLKPDSSYGVGHVHDGYSATYAPAGVKWAAVADGIDLADSDPRGFAYRREFQADQQVAGVFRTVVAQGGPISSTQWGSCSVFARVTGGSLAGDGTKDVRFEGVNAYEARLVTAALVPGWIVQLRRWDAGVATTLDSTTNLLLTSGPIDLALPVEIRLSVEGGSGANPRCVVTYKHSGKMVSTLLIDHVDTSPYAYQATSRAGFSIEPDRREIKGSFAPARTFAVGICESVTIGTAKSTAGYAPEAILMEERWERAFDVGDSTPVDSNGVQGKYLGRGWLRDQFDLSPGGVPLFVERDSTLERVKIDHTTASSSDEGFAVLSMRLASDAVYQHRSVAAQFAAAHAVDERWCGIILRASKTSDVAFSSMSGYVARVGELSGTKTAQVGYYSGGGSFQVLAEYESASLYSDGTDFVVDFDVYALDGSPNPGQAPAVLVLKVDSVQVPLELPSSPISGVTVDAAGAVTDASDDAIHSGLGEGFYSLAVNPAGTSTHEFDDWTQLALHEDQGPPTNVPLVGEGTPVGSLNDVLEPDFQFSVQTVYYHRESVMESGHVERNARFYDPEESEYVGRRVFTYVKGFTDDYEHHRIENFWDEHDGSEIPFSFTTPDDEVVVVVFAEESLRRTKQGPRAYGTRFSLIELQ